MRVGTPNALVAVHLLRVFEDEPLEESGQRKVCQGIPTVKDKLIWKLQVFSVILFNCGTKLNQKEGFKKWDYVSALHESQHTQKQAMRYWYTPKSGLKCLREFWAMQRVLKCLPACMTSCTILKHH
jgi:hypothetical protein